MRPQRALRQDSGRGPQRLDLPGVDHQGGPLSVHLTQGDGRSACTRVYSPLSQDHYCISMWFSPVVTYIFRVVSPWIRGGVYLHVCFVRSSPQGLSTAVSKPHLRNLFYRVRSLLRVGAGLVFVVDGAVSQLKSATMECRGTQRARLQGGSYISGSSGTRPWLDSYVAEVLHVRWTRCTPLGVLLTDFMPWVHSYIWYDTHSAFSCQHSLMT